MDEIKKTTTQKLLEAKEKLKEAEAEIEEICNEEGESEEQPEQASVPQNLVPQAPVPQAPKESEETMKIEEQLRKDEEELAKLRAE